jgi:hypothetical protein
MLCYARPAVHFSGGQNMSYQSRKSMNMELSDNLASDSEFHFSPVLAVVVLVVLVVLETVVK